MRRAYALSEEEFCRAEAELELAVSLGLIGQAGFDALEQRRPQKKSCRRSFLRTLQLYQTDVSAI